MATTITTTVFSSAIASCGVVNHRYPRLVLARKGNKSASAMVFSSSKYALKQLSLHAIRSSTSTRSLQCKSHTTSKEGTVHSSSANSGSHSNSWKNWILGTLLSLILPFWKHKWAPLFAIKSRQGYWNDRRRNGGGGEGGGGSGEGGGGGSAEAAGGGQLQEAVLVVEKIAKKVHEDAHATDEFIHKVEDAGDDIEKGVEAIVEAIDQHDDQTEEIKQEEDQTVAEVTEEVEVIKVEAVSSDDKEENVESKKTI